MPVEIIRVLIYRPDVESRFQHETLHNPYQIEHRDLSIHLKREIRNGERRGSWLGVLSLHCLGYQHISYDKSVEIRAFKATYRVFRGLHNRLPIYVE